MTTNSPDFLRGGSTALTVSQNTFVGNFTYVDALAIGGCVVFAGTTESSFGDNATVSCSAGSGSNMPQIWTLDTTEVLIRDVEFYIGGSAVEGNLVALLDGLPSMSLGLPSRPPIRLDGMMFPVIVDGPVWSSEDLAVQSTLVNAIVNTGGLTRGFWFTDGNEARTVLGNAIRMSPGTIQGLYFSGPGAVHHNTVAGPTGIGGPLVTDIEIRNSTLQTPLQFIANVSFGVGASFLPLRLVVMPSADEPIDQFMTVFSTFRYNVLSSTTSPSIQYLGFGMASDFDQINDAIFATPRGALSPNYDRDNQFCTNTMMPLPASIAVDLVEDNLRDGQNDPYGTRVPVGMLADSGAIERIVSSEPCPILQ
ncbi:MAG: hypothetical protein AAF658_15305 [Myxococcota bacterium]